MESDSIWHYGVLGMRWGVRKQADGSKARTGSAKDKTSGYEPDNPGVGAGGEPAGLGTGGSKAQQRKEARTLSDSELRSRINRMQMEKQYAELSASPQRRSGASKAGNFLLKEGGQVLGNAAKQVATQQVKKQMEKVFSSK